MLFDFECDKCQIVKEVLIRNDETPSCPVCGRKMRKLPSYPALVKVKGSGGYPSRRKMINGSAPFRGGR